MNYEIVNLPKETWKGHILPMGYQTDEYYDVAVSSTEQGYDIQIKKQQFFEEKHFYSVCSNFVTFEITLPHLFAKFVTIPIQQW